MAAVLRKKSERETTLQMAPMIDCVFLLSIFFMVSSVMKNEPSFSVTLPDSETKHEFPRKKYNLFIGQNDELAIDDRTHDLYSMERWLSANQERISTLIIKADRYAKHGRVIDVMERAKLILDKEEGQEIALMVSEENL